MPMDNNPSVVGLPWVWFVGVLRFKRGRYAQAVRRLGGYPVSAATSHVGHMHGAIEYERTGRTTIRTCSCTNIHYVDGRLGRLYVFPVYCVPRRYQAFGAFSV